MHVMARENYRRPALADNPSIGHRGTMLFAVGNFTADPSVNLQLLIGGLALGAIYAVVALGFVLVYKSTDVLNLAHGEFLMLGAYFAVTFLVSEGLNFFLGLVAVLAVMLVFGLFIHYGHHGANGRPGLLCHCAGHHRYRDGDPRLLADLLRPHRTRPADRAAPGQLRDRRRHSQVRGHDHPRRSGAVCAAVLRLLQVHPDGAAHSGGGR